MTVTRFRARAGAVPAWVWLVAIVALSAVFRALLARRMVAPWIMVDELIYGELAKSFAAGGHFMVRGVTSSGYGFVYPMLISPAFRVQSVVSAYGLAKTIDSVLMSLAAVPAYLLARRVVRPSLSLVAAALTVAVPSMVYTGMLMTENAFYVVFLTCALMLVLVLERPTVRRVLGLLGVALLAFLTRAQAVALLPAILTAPLLLPRARWREFRTLYAVVIAAGVLVLLAEVVRGRSPLDALGAYRSATGSQYDVGSVLRWFVYHLGELDLYVGVIPFAALLFLAVTRERREPFVAAALPLIVWLVLEVAAFASTQSQRIEERNMFFVAPLFFVALCVWIERCAPRQELRAGRAAGICATVAGALVGVVPFASFINGNATSDTLGLIPFWTLQDTVTTLDETAAVAVVLAIALGLAWLLVPARFALALPVTVAVLYALALWSIETNPHGGIQHSSQGALFGGTTRPRDWIDARVGASANVAVLYDSRVSDKFTVWTNEFFNRSVGTIADLADPTPGNLPEHPARTNANGFVLGLGTPTYVLSSTPLIGTVAARDAVKGLTLWKLRGRPRVRSITSGVYADGWTGHHARIRRFACAGSTRLTLRQGSLFAKPQLVLVDGKRYRVDGRRTIVVAGCDITIDVPETRVPSPDDARQLGIIVDGYA